MRPVARALTARFDETLTTDAEALEFLHDTLLQTLSRALRWSPIPHWSTRRRRPALVRA